MPSEPNEMEKIDKSVDSNVGSAMEVRKSGLQLQLYTMLYDSNTTVPSNPRYC